MDYQEKLQQWISSQQLVRIELLKGRGTRQSLVGRILNYDSQGKLLLFYQVDEKKVYNLKFNEIEDIEAAQV